MARLANDYSSKPVLFVEQDVDHSVGSRQDRWWAAFTGTTATLPLVMADSGHGIGNGSVDFYTVYKAMVDRELAREPAAEIESASSRVGNRLRFSGWITNRSGVTLSAARNGATVHALVYEQDGAVGSTGRVVRAAVEFPLSQDLAQGAAVSFALETPDLAPVNWDNLHSVVLADYRPGSPTGPFDMLQAAVPYAIGSDVTTTAFFPHVALGGGYTTVFRFVNTGSTAATGQLILTDHDGSPWPVSFSDASAASRSGISSFTTISIPPGGTEFVTASSGASPGLMTGWARVESSGGTLGGVATYYYAPAGSPQTIVGVLSASPLSSATIPRDDDVLHERYSGFAVANPGEATLTIRVLEVGADGSAVVELKPIILGPRSQKAAFFFEDPKAAREFKGTAVLLEQTGANFLVVSLAQDHGIFSAVPAMPGKAPNIGGQTR